MVQYHSTKHKHLVPAASQLVIIIIKHNITHIQPICVQSAAVQCIVLRRGLRAEPVGTTQLPTYHHLMAPHHTLMATAAAVCLYTACNGWKNSSFSFRGTLAACVCVSEQICEMGIRATVWSMEAARCCWRLQHLFRVVWAARRAIVVGRRRFTRISRYI